MSPDHPDVRGTAQNPDVFFQAREACNPYYRAVPGIVASAMDELAPSAPAAVTAWSSTRAPPTPSASSCSWARVRAPPEETVEVLVAHGEKVGMLKRAPLPALPRGELVAALPPSVRAIAVLDRTKEPGAVGEPLYLDVRAAIDEAMEAGEPAFTAAPLVVGGRYGLSSKEFTPAMAKAVFDELGQHRPQRHFTVGINDDVSLSSLAWDRDFAPPRPDAEVQAVFFGLGADGTVGANKNSAKIIGGRDRRQRTGLLRLQLQEVGVDDRLAPALRARADPLDLPDHRGRLRGLPRARAAERVNVLEWRQPGATFLLNSPHPADEVWDQLPAGVQQPDRGEARRASGWSTPSASPPRPTSAPASTP